jgi:predicted kinase
MPLTVLNPDQFLGTPRVWTPERNLAAWETVYAHVNDACRAHGRAATLYIVCGMQGAGKSTWIADHPAFFSTPAIVIDAALPAARHRARALGIAHAHGVRSEAVWVDTPVELALARNAGRPTDEQVPAAAILNVQALFEAPSAAEGFAAVHRVA